MCNSSGHNLSSCPYYAYYAPSDLSLPLTQSMGLEVGEPFGFSASFGMNNALCGMEDTFDMEHNLVDTPLEGCRDVFMHEGFPSLACENVLPCPLEHSHASTFCSQPSFFPEYTYNVPIDNFEICNSNVDMGYANNIFHMLGGKVETFKSLGNFSGYNATLVPYCINLVDKPRKILRNTFFTFSFDFSMAITLRGLISFFVLILMFSHSYACEPHAAVFNKLLRTLIASTLKS